MAGGRYSSAYRKREKPFAVRMHAGCTEDREFPLSSPLLEVLEAMPLATPPGHDDGGAAEAPTADQEADSVVDSSPYRGAGMGEAGEVLSPVPNAKPRRLWWVYEAAMAVLALAAVWLLTVPDEGWARVANLGIWAIFVVDYAVRLAIADDRRRFVRSNIPDLIAILPLDFLRVARLARLARLTRLLRAGTVLWRLTTDMRGVLGTNGLGYVVLITGAVIVAGDRRHGPSKTSSGPSATDSGGHWSPPPRSATATSPRSRHRGVGWPLSSCWWV